MDDIEEEKGMKEVVEVTSPLLNLRCSVCGRCSTSFQQLGEIEVEKSSIPFGVLEEVKWHRQDGTPLQTDEINTLPSICPACAVLGFTIEKEEIIYGS